MKSVLFAAIAACSLAAGAQAAEPLAFDATQKDYIAKPGEESAPLRFHLKNISAGPVTIDKVTTSCGCTVARIPREPWIMAPGEEGDITATVDLRGKSGTVNKTVYVHLGAAMKSLAIVVHLPDPMLDPVRLANRAAAQVNRQAVFQGKCASCHSDPLQGKAGGLLYLAACEVCHDPEHPASMVPSLESDHSPVTPSMRTPEFWRQWITYGKEGTLMPAFGSKQGGPLSSEQIESLVRFLSVPAPVAGKALVP